MCVWLSISSYKYTWIWESPCSLPVFLCLFSPSPLSLSICTGTVVLHSDSSTIWNISRLPSGTWHESKIQYYRILQGGESLMSLPAVFIQTPLSKWNVCIFSHKGRCDFTSDFCEMDCYISIANDQAFKRQSYKCHWQPAKWTVAPTVSLAQCPRGWIQATGVGHNPQHHLLTKMRSKGL